MNQRRLYAPVVLGLLAAGGLGYLGATRTWQSITVRSAGLPSDLVEVGGSDASATVAAVALVTIASSLAVLAASHRVRRVLGVVIVVVALIGMWLVASAGGSLGDALDQAVRESPAFTGVAPTGVDHTSWRWVTAAAFALVATLGVVVAMWGHRWPTMSSRYDAPSAPRGQPDPESGADIWKALDDGTDPTQ